MGLAGSIFQGTTLGLFPLRYCRWPPPSLPALSFFLACFKPYLHPEHQSRPTDILPVNVENSFFFGGGVWGWEHVDQDEWARLALSTPPSVQGLKWRRLKRMRKLRRGREQERRALFLFSPLFVFLYYSDVQSPLHASSIMPRWENDDESPGCKEAKYIKSG